MDSTKRTEAMEKMAEMLNSAPTEKQRDIECFLAGCIAGLEIAVGGKQKENA